MKTMKRIKEEYNQLSDRGRRQQILCMGVMWPLIPAIIIGNSSNKAIRILGFFLSFFWFGLTLPILCLILLVGLSQAIYQDI